jgi:hypothetical protein
MKLPSAAASILLAACLPACAQQATSSSLDTAGTGVAPESRVFRVHVVDGRTGESISGARVQLWYDEPSGPGYSVASGAHGEAPMPKPVGEPIRVLVTVSGYTDCRRSERDAPPEGYNLASIAQSGIAAQNTCGRVALRTGPGELLVYVRPARWYENINKNPSQ